jgi:hypothetical protein
LSCALPELAPKRRVIRQGFNESETARLLSSIDASAAIGKRDFAIMKRAS